MTTSPEEKALLADAYEVNKERRELDSANTAAAIQRGLAEARTSRSSKRRRGQWIAVLCAVSLAVAGIMFASLGDLGQQRLTSSEPEVHWGGLEPFRGLLRTDQESATLTSALNHNYVQRVNQTVTMGKYTFTLDALMADENRVILLYSARTDTPSGVYSMANTKLTDASTGHVIDNGSISSIHFSDQNNVLRGRTTFDRSRSTALPEKLNFEFQLSSVVPDRLHDDKGEGNGTEREKQRENSQERKYEFSKKMNVMVALDPKFSIPKTEIIPVNKTFKFGEYDVLISDVEISPLVTQVRVDYDPKQKLDYEKESFISDIVQPFEIVTFSKKGEKTTLSRNGGRGTGNGMTYSFASNFLDEPQSIILKVQGKPGKVYDNLQDVAKDQFEIKIK
ncbi:DUF4179 domain-containing protein [Paenibacillus cucumis (ex Kampfer et al. 2016)]|uniref:DUF4179 domain-containing protein n=1 Tax=Paenibacillus cucumis (ex Kampfer et al. 2016) TaxID=1776858 RepID=A0ABS7KNT7_9BACL|nr:DUF4179 domain-containing protein [Paenibacillus cucumis (ex Kampfer et al. 2016)]MBY0205832.1 DUF4179 domain-containing protein [Paenibacillus cucumis (ex Kampfer et al. 2016)]